MTRPVFTDLEDRTIEVSRLYRDVLNNPGKFDNPDSREYLKRIHSEEFKQYASIFEEAMNAAETRLEIVNQENVPEALEDISLIVLKKFYDAADRFVDLEQEYAETAAEHNLEYESFDEIEGYPLRAIGLMDGIEELRDEIEEESDHDFLRGY